MEKDLEKNGTEQNGIYEEAALINQLQCAYNILQTKDPDKVITIGGDCSVSQPAFDFLHGKYPEKTCIIWLDAHPDISSPSVGWKNEHAMVLGNLLGDGVPNIAKIVKNKFYFL